MDIFTVGDEILSEEVGFIFLREFAYQDLDMHIPIFFVIMVIAEYDTHDFLSSIGLITDAYLDITTP